MISTANERRKLGEELGIQLPAKVDRDGLINYAALAAELGVPLDQVRTWHTRNTARIRDLALSGLKPPVWVRDEVVPVLRAWMDRG